MITPLTCTKCGKEFAAEQGGRCSGCGEFFCHSCLLLPKPERKKGTPVCDSCRLPKKEYIRASKFFPPTLEL